MGISFSFLLCILSSVSFRGSEGIVGFSAPGAKETAGGGVLVRASSQDVGFGFGKSTLAFKDGLVVERTWDGRRE